MRAEGQQQQPCVAIMLAHLFRNSDNNNILSRYVDGKTIYAKSYPKNECKKLSPAQKKALSELHKQQKKHNASSSSQSHDSHAVVSAIKSIRKENASLNKAIINGISRTLEEDNSTIGERSVCIYWFISYLSFELGIDDNSNCYIELFWRTLVKRRNALQ